MNERIKLLAEQAGKRGSPDHPLYWTNGINDTLEKFAELIVRECALQCVHNEDMDLIEKHFGVKE